MTKSFIAGDKARPDAEKNALVNDSNTVVCAKKATENRITKSFVAEKMRLKGGNQR